MLSHLLEAIFARIERLVRESVAFELSDDAVITRKRQRNEILAEHVCRASPAWHHDDQWRAVFSGLHKANADTGRKIEKSCSKLGPLRGKHGKRIKPIWTDQKH